MPCPSSPLQAKSYKLKASDGFTLLETMIVVGIIAILGGLVITGVNPARQIANTRNAQRVANVEAIQGAINHYAISTFTGYPAGIDTTLRMLGTAASGCAVTCGPDELPPPPPPTVTSFADDTQTELDAGLHASTQWSSTASALALNSIGLTNKTGTYLSQIFDAGSSVSWNSLSWVTGAGYGKALPNSAANESGYTSNASMTSNVLLMHMDNLSGSITDSSGQGNNGTIFGTVAYGANAVFSKGLTPNGSNGYVRVNSASNLNLPNTGGGVMLWIKPTVNLAQDTGMGILRKPDYSGNLYSPGGYGMEIYRNPPGGPQNIKMHLGWNSGLSSSQQTLTGVTNIVSGQWYHVAMTWNATTMYVYVNGQLDGSAPRTSGPLNWANGSEKLYIGHNAASISNGRAWYSGVLDEVAVFGRQLNGPEIQAAYQRGVHHPKLRIRSCNDAACAGETFVGPDGTTATYFSEENNSGNSPAPFTPNVGANRYFQYQVILDTDTSSFGPDIPSISGGNNGTPGGGGTPGTSTTEPTAEACLDLTSVLAPTYITAIPHDPQTGDDARTYYAVKKLNMDNLVVRACSPELGKSIEVSQ